MNKRDFARAKRAVALAHKLRAVRSRLTQSKDIKIRAHGKYVHVDMMTVGSRLHSDKFIRAMNSPLWWSEIRVKERDRFGIEVHDAQQLQELGDAQEIFVRFVIHGYKSLKK